MQTQKFILKSKLEKINAISNTMHDEFEYDSKDKIDKKFNYFCKNYSYLWQNDESLDKEIKSPKLNSAKSLILRSSIRKKALIPEYKRSPFSPDFSKITSNTIKSKATINEISKFNKKAAPKEVKFWCDENGDENKIGNEIQKSRLQQTFKYIYEENYVNENQRKNITEFFGNAVIAAVMESLINLSVNEINKFQQKDKNINISNW